MPYFPTRKDSFREKWTALWIHHYSHPQGDGRQHPSLASLLFPDDSPLSLSLDREADREIFPGSDKYWHSSFSVETKRQPRPLPPSPVTSSSSSQSRALRALPQIPNEAKKAPSLRKDRNRPIPILLVSPNGPRMRSPDGPLILTPSCLHNLKNPSTPSGSTSLDPPLTTSFTSSSPPIPSPPRIPQYVDLAKQRHLPDPPPSSTSVLSPLLSSAAAFGFRDHHRPKQTIPTEVMEEDSDDDSMYTSEAEDDYQPYGGLEFT